MGHRLRATCDARTASQAGSGSRSHPPPPVRSSHHAGPSVRCAPVSVSPPDVPDPHADPFDRPDQPVLSVVTPTFNEVDNVGLLIDRLHAALDGISHEIIVADDDSP